MAVKAFFLDRDGVINEDTGYVFQEKHFHFVDGIFELCRTAMNKGYIIVVVTNQSGIERGYFTEADFQSLTQWMLSRFVAAGVVITEVLHCPMLSGHERKPNPGMFLAASKKHDIDMPASVSLGNSERDVQAGRRAGVGMNVLLSHTNHESEADRVIATLKEMESIL